VKIVVHHLETSRSSRILWMLEELGLDYEVKIWKRNRNFRAPDEAQSVHPLGRFPMVEVDGQVLAESGAIMDFFADKTGKLIPTKPEDLQEYRFFMHYGEGSAMPPLLVQLILDRLRKAPLPFFIKPIAKAIAGKIEENYSGPAIDLHFGFIDDVLRDRDFFAGDEFTMADIQMSYPVEASVSRGGGDRPYMAEWLKRMQARPAYQRALAKGGPVIP